MRIASVPRSGERGRKHPVGTVDLIDGAVEDLYGITDTERAVMVENS